MVFNSLQNVELNLPMFDIPVTSWQMMYTYMILRNTIVLTWQLDFRYIATIVDKNDSLAYFESQWLLKLVYTRKLCMQSLGIN